MEKIYIKENEDKGVFEIKGVEFEGSKEINGVEELKNFLLVVWGFDDFEIDVDYIEESNKEREDFCVEVGMFWERWVKNSVDLEVNVCYCNGFISYDNDGFE